MAIMDLEYIEIDGLFYPNIEVEGSELLKKSWKVRTLALGVSSRIQAGNVPGIAFHRKAGRALCCGGYARI